MEKRSMIFFDIDGTLLDHDKKLPASTKEAIRALKEAGHEVAIATGRAPFMFPELRKELEIESFVSFNGQYVVFNGEVIYKNPLNRNVLQSLTNAALKSSHPLVYMDHETMRATTGYHPHIEESMGTLKFAHPEHDPHYFKEREIYQSLLFCTDNDEIPYKESFRDFHFIRWHQYSTDVLPFGGSKARGIEKAIEKMGFTKDEVYAFGDGLNDIEMLQYVGNGIAMGNAHDSVKKIAKHVTKNVDEDGIVHGLELVGLLK
ncbi:MAG TPA: Cof-type HAD-IIB family hydrolase [Bacillus sp. (in: firmicutes)]|nr:Cof-type HAD-IIB family hydrolase [Bacillus sp. (in: firmicutes)]